MELPRKNSDLFRRLRLYGFGFVMGLLVVSFIYKGKGCQLPGSAKLEELAWQKAEYTDHARCRMKCNNVTESEVQQVFKSGKVNYDKSDVHNKPYPTYTVEGPTATGKKLRILVADVDTVSRIMTAMDVKMENDSCDCK